MKTKKVIVALLTVCMMLASVTVAFAAGEYNGKTIILHTNDVHGEIAKYANVAGIKNDFESKGADVILVDAGDYLQGSTYVAESKGVSAITMMNAVGYDVATIGNHEFDYGWGNLVDVTKNAQFEIVCSNVYTESKLMFESNYTYTTDSGLKVGFFGLDTPETMTQTNPEMVKGVTFESGEDLYATATQQVKALAGDDVVICLTHLGVSDQTKPNRSEDVYAKTSGIDFIIDGHSHTVMEQGENGEPIQSTGTKLANVGVIVIDNSTKKIEDNYLMPITADSPIDASVKAVSDGIIDEINKEYGQVFAKSEVELNGDRNPGNRTSETNLGDLITDAMRWKILDQDKTISVPESNVVAIVNGGGIRAWIHAGDVTKNDVFTVLPFGNTLCVVYVTGAELLEALEASTFAIPGENGGFPHVSGISYTINSYKPYDPNEETYPNSTYYGPKSINRIKINDIGGKKFKKDATYAVITSNFIANGGDTYYAFARAESKYDTGIALDQVVMDYITEVLGGVIDSRYENPQGRITVNTEAPTGIKAILEKISDWFINQYNDGFLKYIRIVVEFIEKLFKF